MSRWLNAWRSVVCAGAAALLTQGAAFAFPDSVTAAFGNTIVSTYADGRQAELWLTPDGTYTAKSRTGDDSRGTWRVKDTRLCMRQHAPIWAPFEFCSPIPERTDQSWTARAFSGDQVSVSIIAGHFIGRFGPAGSTQNQRASNTTPARDE